MPSRDDLEDARVKLQTPLTRESWMFQQCFCRYRNLTGQSRIALTNPALKHQKGQLQSGDVRRQEKYETMLRLHEGTLWIGRIGLYIHYPRCLGPVPWLFSASSACFPSNSSDSCLLLSLHPAAARLHHKLPNPTLPSALILNSNQTQSANSAPTSFKTCWHQSITMVWPGWQRSTVGISNQHSYSLM